MFKDNISIKRNLIIFIILGFSSIFLFKKYNIEEKISYIKNFNLSWLEFCIVNTKMEVNSPSVTMLKVHDDYKPLDFSNSLTNSSKKNFSKLDYAIIINFLNRLDPKSILFLPFNDFDQKDYLNKEGDLHFKESISKLPKFIASSYTKKNNNTQKLKYPKISIKNNNSIKELKKNLYFVKDQTIESSLLENSLIGFNKIKTTKENDIKIAMIGIYDNKIIPSSLLLSLANYIKLDAKDIFVNLSTSPYTIKIGNKYNIKLDEHGFWTLPYITKSFYNIDDNNNSLNDYNFTTLNVDEIAYIGENFKKSSNLISNEYKNKFQSIKNNIVIFGFDRKEDKKFQIPNGNYLSKLQILSLVIGSIQSNRIFYLSPQWIELVSMLFVSLFISIIFNLKFWNFIFYIFIGCFVFFSILALTLNQTMHLIPPFLFFYFFVFSILFKISISLIKKY